VKVHVLELLLIGAGLVLIAYIVVHG